MTATITNEYLRKEFDNFEKSQDLGNLIEELGHSTLLVPVDERQAGCAMVTIEDEAYIPVFTDIHEYMKVDLSDDFHPEVFDFNFYLELLKNGLHGFIINVESERFPITREFLDFLDTNYIFDLDYRPFTVREIKGIYNSIDNSELEEFLKSDENRWNSDELMEILLDSDILTAVASDDALNELEDSGVILAKGKLSYCRTGDRFAVIFSSPDKIRPPHSRTNFYAQLVNLPLFIDNVLKSDLSGLKLDEDIVISRDFLLDFMKDFNCPCVDKYDDYLFPIE